MCGRHDMYRKYGNVCTYPFLSLCFFDKSQLQRFKEDIAASSFSFGTQAIEQAIEQTKANIKWISENKAQVMNWLIEQTA